MSDTPDRDELTGKDTTGHEWDGIKELNTPLPKWWLNVFYACIVFSLAYFVVFPAWPYFDGSSWKATGGVVGYSQRETVTSQVASARAALSDELDAMRDATLREILADERLRTVAYRAGESHFGDNCAGCHGSGAQGYAGEGFPNLRDDDWIWGGTLDAIRHTIRHGVRWERNDDTRFSQMPAYGADGLLSESEIAAAAHHVLSLSGQDHDPALADRGGDIYAQQCSFCHGANGEGMREVGAPALNDAIWLYGGDLETVTESITYARYGVMPAWEGRLTDLEIKQLTLFVHLLGGGETKLDEVALGDPSAIEGGRR